MSEPEWRLPLIALTQIARLDLLHQLHPLVLIPLAVAREVEPAVPALPDWLVDAHEVEIVDHH